jgi:hypothetical protein
MGTQLSLNDFINLKRCQSALVVIAFDLCVLYYTVMSPVYLHFPLPLINTITDDFPSFYVLYMAPHLSYEKFGWEGVRLRETEWAG